MWGMTDFALIFGLVALLVIVFAVLFFQQAHHPVQGNDPEPEPTRRDADRAKVVVKR